MIYEINIILALSWIITSYYVPYRVTVLVIVQTERERDGNRARERRVGCTEQKETESTGILGDFFFLQSETTHNCS